LFSVILSVTFIIGVIGLVNESARTFLCHHETNDLHAMIENNISQVRNIDMKVIAVGIE
jgi:hypothetical protein